MKIPPAIVCLALGALLSLQAWTANSVVSLREQVAKLEARLPVAAADSPQQTEIEYAKSVH